ALFTSPAGERALTALLEDLRAGRATARDLILNPDQADLDLEKTATTLQAAFDAARSDGEAARAQRAASVAQVRLDDDVLAALIASVRDAASVDSRAAPRDIEALAAIDRAELEIAEAKGRLVTGNVRLVVLFARKYLGRGVPLLDLVQEG